MHGHYQLALTRNYRPPSLKDNPCVTLQRPHFLKNRSQDRPLMEKYCKTQNDYIAKCYARKVQGGQIDLGGKPLWYLPQYPVIHEHKPGKVEVVFDCSA